MVTVQRTLRTTRPVERVFGSPADLTHASGWDAGAVVGTLTTELDRL